MSCKLQSIRSNYRHLTIALPPVQCHTYESTKVRFFFGEYLDQLRHSVTSHSQQRVAIRIPCVQMQISNQFEHNDPHILSNSAIMVAAMLQEMRRITHRFAWT
eukprot:505590_1